MITQWQYTNHGSFRDYVKTTISNNLYSCIDIGASARYWSYPECKIVADAYPVEEKDVLYFELNIEDSSSWSSIYNYVDKNGKFDFSICSHTMEDVFNPIELASHLSKISNKGYIAVPSKFDEFTKLYNNTYRGNAHHKQLFDIINNEIIVFPKYNWIETDSRTDILLKNYSGNELIIFWEDKIPIKIFGNGKPFIGDDSLINEYFNKLM